MTRQNFCKCFERRSEIARIIAYGPSEDFITATNLEGFNSLQYGGRNERFSPNSDAIPPVSGSVRCTECRLWWHTRRSRTRGRAAPLIDACLRDRWCVTQVSQTFGRKWGPESTKTRNNAGGGGVCIAFVFSVAVIVRPLSRVSCIRAPVVT